MEKNVVCRDLPRMLKVVNNSDQEEVVSICMKENQLLNENDQIKFEFDNPTDQFDISLIRIQAFDIYRKRPSHQLIDFLSENTDESFKNANELIAKTLEFLDNEFVSDMYRKLRFPEIIDFISEEKTPRCANHPEGKFRLIPMNHFSAYQMQSQVLDCPVDIPEEFREGIMESTIHPETEIYFYIFGSNESKEQELKA